MNDKANASGTRNPHNNQKRIQLQGAFKLLRPELKRAIGTAGYIEPTPVQEQSIPELLRGRDIIGIAQTGTGKTAAFVLPLLQRIAARPRKARPNGAQALILAPTRELAAQIGDSIHTYGKFLHLRHTTIFGGVNQFQQVKILKKGVHILVATPGRLLDLVNQGHVSLDQIDYFILDEVDRMLDMGFQPDIRRILKLISKERQTMFFSATMPPKIADLAHSMVHEPILVSIKPEKPTVDRIDQKVMFVGKQHKDALLLSLLDESVIYKAIVFTQMKHIANRVTQKLNKAGIKATAIHGNKSQNARTQALEGFKGSKFKVLVATDVAARGLDVDDISHVINYDLPVEAETYVHRIGRTARAGARGDAISFCTAEERAYLNDIEHLLGSPVVNDLEHAYHSDEALHSTVQVPKRYGGGASGRSSQRRKSAKRRPRGRRYR